jgi:hypothetical protein
MALGAIGAAQFKTKLPGVIVEAGDQKPQK